LEKWLTVITFSVLLLATLGFQNAFAQDAIVFDNHRAKNIDFGNLDTCGPQPDDIPDSQFSGDFDGDGEEDSWVSNVIEISNTGHIIEVWCVDVNGDGSGDIYVLIVRTGSAIRAVGGCEFSVAENSAVKWYMDNNFDGVYTNGIDTVLQTRWTNNERVNLGTNGVFDQNFFIYNVLDNSLIRMDFILDLSVPGYVIDPDNWPPKKGPAPSGVSPEDLIDQLFGSEPFKKLEQTTACLVEPAPYVMSDPEPASDVVAIGGDVTVQGDIIPLDGFSDPVNLWMAIGDQVLPDVQMFDLGIINPPYPAHYEATASLPNDLPPGEYLGVVWTENSDMAVSAEPFLIRVGSFAVGGELLPIDSTSLLVAGAQSFSWMIPLILSGIGIGLFVVSRKSKNS